MTVILERVKILNLLMTGQKTITEILEKVDIEQEKVQKHVKTLLNLEMIEKREDGESIMYSVNESNKKKVNELISTFVKK